LFNMKSGGLPSFSAMGQRPQQQGISPGGYPAQPQMHTMGAPAPQFPQQAQQAMQQYGGGYQPQLPQLPQAGGGQPGGFNPQAMQGQFGEFRQGMQDWRSQRPDRQGFDGDRDAWRQGMQDWRQSRPDLWSFLGQGQG
jgi:hypothetical protein